METRIGLNFIAESWQRLPTQKSSLGGAAKPVAFALGKQIPKELREIFGKHDISVEVYASGGRKKGFGENQKNLDELTSDLIITNIDTLLNPYVKHNIIDRVYDFTKSIIVFDEAHEFVTDEPLFFNFLQFVTARRLHSKMPTLLMTATPLPFQYFWDFAQEEEKTQIFDHKDLPHWNKKPVELHLMDQDSDFLQQNKGLTVTNSIRLALAHSVEHPQNYFLHSSFTDSDAENLLNKVLNTYGKNQQEQNQEQKISSCLIVQSAFDISLPVGVESVLSPMKTLQVLGRINRFGKSERAEFYLANCFENGPHASNERAAINTIFDLNLAKRWWSFLTEMIAEKPTYSRDELSSLYFEFLQENSKGIYDWLKSSGERSIKSSQELVPKRFPMQKKELKAVEGKRVSAANLRSITGSFLVTAANFSYDKEKGLIDLKKYLTTYDLMTCNKKETEIILEAMVRDEQFIQYLEKIFELLWFCLQHEKNQEEQNSR